VGEMQWHVSKCNAALRQNANAFWYEISIDISAGYLATLYANAALGNFLERGMGL